MPTPKEIREAKLRARLERLPANSGHAKVIRARLGIPHDAPVAEPAPVVEEALEVSAKVTKKPKVKRTKKD